jgi:hypothetical protein
MKALKYFIASLLLTSGTTFAQTETVDHKIDITHQNSSLVKIRDIETNKDLLNPIIHGRLTRSYLSRDIDPGFIEADIKGDNGETIERKRWDLEYLYDGDNSRFSSFEISLPSPVHKIKAIHITHKGYE